MPDPASPISQVSPNPTGTITSGTLAGLKQAASPMDFVRQNMRQEEPQFNPQQVAATEEAKRQEAAQQAAEPVIEPPTIEVGNGERTQDAAAKSPEGTTPETSVESLDDFGAEIGEGSSSAENFKKLRVKAKEASKKAKELETENQTLKGKVTEYETGTIVPEVLQEKENEIQRLSYFEKLFNLKGSKEYQDKFLTPVTELQTKLLSIAKDYEVPESVMTEALGFTNKAELNRFLESHFDSVGALEVKQLVDQVKTIQSQASEAEKAPADALTRLITENKQAKEIQRAERVTNVVNTSKSAWVEALTSIQREGKIPELTTMPGNNEHNEKIVKPHRTAAAVEYGKIVKLLAENGLENISPELAGALAKSTLLAHVSATAIASRNHTAKHADELEQNTKRTTSYERPPIGGSFANGSGTGTQKATEPKQQIADHLNSILSKTQR